MATNRLIPEPFIINGADAIQTYPTNLLDEQLVGAIAAALERNGNIHSFIKHINYYATTTPTDNN